MTKERYSIAFSELIYIINNMSKVNRDKIPEEFIEFLKQNKNENYVPQNISLNNKDSLKRETKIMIAIMYRDYFMSEKERNKREVEDKLTLEKIYSYDNMFGQESEIDKEKNDTKNTIQVEDIAVSEKSLVEIKEESRIVKIVNLIKERIKKFITRFVNKR